MDKLSKLWDDIILYNIATEDELQLVTSINGYNEDALNDIIYVRTGYRDMDSYTESE